MNAHLADQDRAKPARILRELIRKRAERKAGQTLKEMPKNKGGPKRAKNNAVLDDYLTPSKLSDLGIKKNQSSKWQKEYSSNSEEEFEAKLAKDDPD